MLVERQDLQLDGEIDLAYVHPVGNYEYTRGEVQDAGDAGLDEPVGDALGRVRRGGDHRDGDLFGGDDVGQVLGVPDDKAVDPLADAPPVGVEQRGDAEPPGAEPGVPGQRVPEVADTHERDPAPLGEPEDVLDLPDEQGHVVAHAPRAVRAQVRQVLAQLGGVHPGRGGQLFAGHGVVPRFGEVVQGPQVLRQARDGRLGKVRKIGTNGDT